MKDHPIKDLLSFFDARYQEHVGARYPVNGGKDSKTIKDLREMYSDEDIRSFMAAFFEMPDPFIEQSGYAIGVFRGCLPKIIQFAKGKHPQQRERVLSDAAQQVFRVIGGSKAS